MFQLIVGISLLLSGVLMLCQLPGYQRRVEAGEIQRDASRPSFKTLRRVAVSLAFFGIVFICAWRFDLF